MKTCANHDALWNLPQILVIKQSLKELISWKGESSNGHFFLVTISLLPFCSLLHNLVIFIIFLSNLIILERFILSFGRGQRNTYLDEPTWRTCFSSSCTCCGLCSICCSHPRGWPRFCERVPPGRRLLGGRIGRSKTKRTPSLKIGVRSETTWLWTVMGYADSYGPCGQLVDYVESYELSEQLWTM